MPDTQLVIDATGGKSFITPVTETSSGALTEQTEEVGFIRQRVHLLDDDAHGLHDQLRRREIEQRAATLAKASAVELLSSLYTKGFAWRDIARMVRVSVPALQKWRKGERINGENRLKLAELNALIGMLEDHLITDPASWFEVPLKGDVAVNPIDLCEAGRYDLVLEWGTGHARSAEPILDSFDENWREKFVDPNFESFVGADGLISIRPRS